jgi:arabinofuranan 3-O-arabinosyltransferase
VTAPSVATPAAPDPPPIVPDVPATAGAAPGPPAAVRRLRLLLCCAVLGLIAFWQAPGLIVPDTKLDLTAAPADFLFRALALWEPRNTFGQVQNQSYGYLFPVGPFFALGHLVGLDGWVLQRLWWSALLCVAFLGMVRLTALLGVRRFTPQVIAAFAFALSPRLITTLGPISVEALPSCVAPWVLIPLVRTARGQLSARSGAARSALAVAAAGGVNAVAAGATLVLPVIWIATRQRGPARRRLAAWWSGGVLAAIAWWVIPLLVLGRVSPDFLGRIETAPVTTAHATLLDSIRGASHWLAYFVDSAGPSWPGGYALVSIPTLVLDTVAVAAIGLYGIAGMGGRERRWTLLAVLTGLALVTFGHLGQPGSPIAGWQQSLLDHQLAPLRNLHKFDLVLRLPLIIGFAWAVDRWFGRAAAWRRTWRRSPAPGRRRFPLDLLTGGAAGHRAVVPWTAVALVCAVVAVVGAASPALVGKLAPAGANLGIPPYWQDAADYLTERAANGRALVVPGSRFADQIWGNTHDEPLQPLARTPWAVRDAVPLTPAGTVRLMDTVDAELASGLGSPQLAALLARSGVTHLVVRNDLDRRATEVPRPVLVHNALAASPGLIRVATFGPVLGTARIGNTVVDRGLDLPYQAVEIYQVDPVAGTGSDRPISQVSLTSVNDVLVVGGGPESILSLLGQGWAQNRPVVLAGDVPTGAGNGLGYAQAAVTDDLRRREVSLPDGPEYSSATLTKDDPLRLSRALRDNLPEGTSGGETVAVLNGVRRVGASSSASDPNGLVTPVPADQPFAAVDGLADTAWYPRLDAEQTGQWWEVTFDRPTDVSATTLRLAPAETGLFGTSPTTRTTVTAITDGGEVRKEVTLTRRPIAGEDEPPVDPPVGLGLPTVATSRLRIRIDSVNGPSRIGIAEVAVPGLSVTRPLAVPTGPGGARAAVVLHSPSDPPGCVLVGTRPMCSSVLADRRGTEEPRGLDRLVPQPLPATAWVTVAVTPRSGAGLDQLLAQGAPIRATASSSQVKDPLGGPAAVIDGKIETGWSAGPGDQRPTLDLQWDGVRTVSGFELFVDNDSAVSRPASVVVQAPSGERRARIPADGKVRFDPIATDRMSIQLSADTITRSIDVNGTAQLLPIGVDELKLISTPTSPAAPDTATRLVVPCEQGPTLRVGAQLIRFSISATRDQWRAGGELPATVCARTAVTGGSRPDGSESEPADQVRLAAGLSRVQATDTDLVRITTVAMKPVGWRTGLQDPTPDAVIGDWGRESRSVTVGARLTPSLLAVRENTNIGWEADLDGRRLTPVVVDGWQQGWLVPAGGPGVVKLRYRPGTAYRAALVAGGVLLVLTVLLAVRPGRRRPDGQRPAAGTIGSAPRSWWYLPAVLVLIILIAGPLAALPALVGWAVLARWRPARVARALAFGAGGSVLLAGSVRAIGGLDSSSWIVVQSLVALALVVAVLAAHTDDHGNKPDIPDMDRPVSP